MFMARLTERNENMITAIWEDLGIHMAQVYEFIYFYSQPFVVSSHTIFPHAMLFSLLEKDTFTFSMWIKLVKKGP